MVEEVTYLKNHSRTISSAEEAIDFNYNEPTDYDSEINENLVTPFIHFFSNVLTPNSLIVVDGFMLKDAISFRIDFCTYNENVAFHINPRLDQKFIARNSKIESKWGVEERYATRSCPIERGKGFEIQIFVLSTKFLVSINGEHMFEYQHRVPLYEICRIEVFGDISLENVAIFKSNEYPSPSNRVFKSSGVAPVLPYTHFIKHGLGTFGKITVKGKVKLLPITFCINIQTTNKVFPHPKILYHFNPRYGTSNYVVENSWGLRGETWDEEVRSPLPRALSPGNIFSLDIVTTNSYIQVSGDGWFLPQFFHRLNPDCGFYIYIEGDIILSAVKVYPDLELMSAV